MLIHHRFEQFAAQSPATVAIVDRTMRVTAEALNAGATRLAACLQRRGVGLGTPVAVCVPRSLAFVEAMIAVLKCGGVLVPLEPDEPRERLRHIFTEVGIRHAITTRSHAALDVIAAIDALVLEDLPAPDWDFHPVVQSPESIALIFYTTGSTGQPSGVLIPHRARVNRLIWELSAYGITKLDVVLFRTPVNFARVVKEVFWGLSVGAPLALVSPGRQNDPAEVLAALLDEGVTVMSVTPSLLALLVQDRSFTRCRLRIILSEGEPLTATLADRVLDQLPGLTLFNPYGMTEVSTVCAGPRLRGSLRGAARIGRPAGLPLYLLDEHGKPVNPGIVGEICVGGEGIAAGYVNQPGLTARRFVPDPFSAQGGTLFRSGDLGRWLADGELEYVGRSDSQVKIRGHRVELAEIERAISAHPDVAETVVLASDDAMGTTRLVAYVALKPEAAEVTRQQLRRYLADRLPEYMIPVHLVVLPRLPRTANGKVNRRELPPAPFDRPKLAEPYTAPANELEQQLSAIWEAALAVRPVGVADNFFDLGGDSLLAVGMLLEVESITGRSLPVGVLLEAPTVRLLATAVSRTPAATARALIAVQPHGTRTPFFCIHGMFGNVLCFRPLACRLGSDQPFYGLQFSGPGATNGPACTVEGLASAYLEEVRSLQSRGPYAIGGYSFGALVAYEMARQLIEDGEIVRFVAVIDSASPGVRRGLPPFSDYRVMLDGAGMVTGMLSMTIRDAMCGLAHTDWTYNSAFTVADPRGYEVARATTIATRNYRPCPAPVRMVLFRTTDQSSRLAFEPEHGWSKLATDGVNVIDIDGDHVTCLSEPWVATLGRHLGDQLYEGMRP